MEACTMHPPQFACRDRPAGTQMKLRGAHVCVWVQARHRACMQLVGEIEVQGRAIDAARTNVERHYRFIHDAYGDFMRKYAPGM